MKKRGWIALLCGLLAVCPALAEQTDGVVRGGEGIYDVQTVQNALNAGYQLYESSGISLSAAQKQQLADSVLERFVGLGVLENQLRREGQAEIDEPTRQALDEQARQAYEAAWQQMAEAIRSGTPNATDEQISAFLTHMGYTLDAYRQEAELTLKNQRLIALYCGDISVTDQEVQDYYEQQYVSVYRARYEDDIPLFEQEVLLSGGQTYYIPEGYRRIKHIVMALPDADAASAQIAAIYQALDAGESFESQMQRYSYDTSVPPEDAGYLLHDDSQLWDEAFLSAALALEKPGDVSEPVVTSAGVHIILYAADEPAGPLALTDEQHNLLTQAALTDKQTRRLEELVSQWREAYDIETHPEWLTFYDE